MFACQISFLKQTWLIKRTRGEYTGTLCATGQVIGNYRGRYDCCWWPCPLQGLLLYMERASMVLFHSRHMFSFSFFRSGTDSKVLGMYSVLFNAIFIMCRWHMYWVVVGMRVCIYNVFILHDTIFLYIRCPTSVQKHYNGRLYINIYCKPAYLLNILQCANKNVNICIQLWYVV